MFFDSEILLGIYLTDKLIVCIGLCIVSVNRKPNKHMNVCCIGLVK
jgi:hypothetical protein